jgi:hypothetical protein
MDSVAVAVLVVVLAAFLFGMVTAPLGLALGLPPPAVAVGVLLGSAAFAVLSVPLVVDRVPSRVTGRVRLGLRHAPRIARWWDRAGGRRIAGGRGTGLVDRGSALLDRLGYRGVAVLAPLLGRWLVPSVAVALDPPRADLYRWAVLGCATWAVVGTLGSDLLIHSVGIG